jgi:hypothetical protein
VPPLSELLKSLPPPTVPVPGWLMQRPLTHQKPDGQAGDWRASQENPPSMTLGSKQPPINAAATADAK